jgi:hypothetical protein
MTEPPKNEKLVRAYFDGGKRFAQYIFINNELTETSYFKIEDGREIPCEPPETNGNFSMSLNLNNPHEQNIIEVRDAETGNIVKTMDRVEEISVLDTVKLKIRASDKEQWKEALSPIDELSDENKEKIRKTVFPAPIEDGNSTPKLLYVDQVSRAIEDILSEQNAMIPPTFYKGINPEEGFGVERFVLDRVYHLQNLLKNIQLDHLSGTNYLVSSEQKDSSGNSIKLEHRFQATSEQEALKLYEKIAAKLAGVQQKIWLACWSLGNKLKKFTYKCQLTELMHLTYPDRNGYFSVSDKIEFYEHLKSLEQTRFVFSKPYKKGNRKKDLRISYTIPLISIPVQLGDGDKYPQQITLSIRSFDPDPVHEKISHVGAEIKHKTLELHADDMQLSTWLQARKNQKQKQEFIEADLEFLFRLAGLERTAATNKSEAKRLLKNKMQRLVEKGILLGYPEKLDNPICLKIR